MKEIKINRPFTQEEIEIMNLQEKEKNEKNPKKKRDLSNLVLEKLVKIKGIYNDNED